MRADHEAEIEALVAGDLALSGPTDAVAAEVLGQDGALLGTVPLTAGSGVGTLDGTTVRFLGADGAVLAEAAVSEIGG